MKDPNKEWMSKGKIGCTFASLFAKKPESIGWKTITSPELFEIPEDCMVLSVQFPGYSREQVINWALKNGFFTIDVNDECVGLRYMIGDKVSWVQYFGPDAHAKTRQAPIPELCMTVKMPAKYYVKVGFKGILHLAHASVANLTEEMCDILWDSSHKNTKKKLGHDPTVKEAAINNMNEDWKITRDSYAFQDLKRLPEWKRPTVEPSMTSDKPNAIIFDIDGTLALMHNRGPYDWDKVDRDRVNNIVVDQINLNKAAGRKILLVSGRDEECRAMTIDWLQTYDIHFDELLMRPLGSSTKDSAVKKDIYLNQIEPRFNVLAIFDDRLQVIKAWNKLGLFVFNVNQGNIDF